MAATTSANSTPPTQNIPLFKIDYRRNGVITLFTGVGLFIFGIFFLGQIMKAVGALVSLVGLGTIIAGYLYPNTGKELSNAVEEFEKK